MRVLAATGHGAPGWFHDEEGLPAALRAVGIEVEARHWRDIEPDGTPILLRTAWDYTQHPEAFAAWLDRIDATGTTCLNPPDLVRWNMDKRYLLELEHEGFAIVATEIVAAYDVEHIDALLAEHGWTDAIVKPVVGGGAEGLVRVRDGRHEALGTPGNTWAPDASATPTGACIVQPYCPEIQAGEWSLFFFGGGYSHAVLKTPGPGDIRVQEEHGGLTRGAEPPESVRLSAARLVEHVGAPVARVDGLVIDDVFHLMELELIEPELYFRYADGAEHRFAQAMVALL